MTTIDRSDFLELVKNQFSEKERSAISEQTDFKALKEWSSLQTMIVVNEIHKQYNVILNSDDLATARNLGELCQIVESRKG